MHTALMRLSALGTVGTVWLLPHPRQSHSSSLGYPGLAPLLSTRETPPTVLMSSYTKRTESGSSVAAGLLGREESRAQPVNDFSKPSSSQQLPQKETAEPQKPMESAAASISHLPPTDDEPLCKLQALGTDSGFQRCAQVLRATTEPLAAVLGKSRVNHGPRQEQSKNSGGCHSPHLVPHSQPPSPPSPSVKTGLAFLGLDSLLLLQ